MKSYDRPTLAAIARNVIKKYDPYLLYCEPCAVPIEKITEQFYGLDVEYCHLRKNGLVLGCTIFDNTLLPIWDADECQYGVMRVNGGTIVIEASLLDERKQGRLRFTFAHELAHWLLHKELYVGEGIAAASAIKTSLEVNPVVERQADVLASYLLMPKNQVKRAFYAIQDKPNPTSYLSSLFGVSKQAMGIFLKDHNLPHA